MNATMKCSTASLRTGQRVTIIERDDPFLTVQDAAGGQHLIMTGDVIEDAP